MESLTHKNFVIEKTLISDLDRACQLYHDAMAFQIRKGYPQYVSDDRSAQARFIKAGNHYKIMAEDKMIAMYNLQFTDKKIWGERELGNEVYLHGVLVDTNFKGKGIFKLILDRVIEFCKINGLTRIRLDTWADNPKLESYYINHGFEVVGHFQIPIAEDLPLNCQGNKVVLMEFVLPY